MCFAFRFSKTWQITFFSPKKNTWRHSMVFYKLTLKRRESKKALALALTFGVIPGVT